MEKNNVTLFIKYMIYVHLNAQNMHDDLVRYFLEESKKLVMSMSQGEKEAAHNFFSVYGNVLDALDQIKEETND